MMQPVVKRNAKLLLLSFPVVIFLCVVSYFFIDIPAARFFHSQAGDIRKVSEIVTRLGVSTWYLVLSMLGFVFYRFVRRRTLPANRLLFIFIVIAASGILNNILKFLFGRYRPNMLFNEHLYGFTFFSVGHACNSFPSGHANTITALALALYLITRRYGLAYLLLALLVMASRIVVGAHYPSDVLFGSYLAVVTTLAVKTAFENRGFALERAPELGQLSGAS